jgi:thymidylate kinase
VTVDVAAERLATSAPDRLERLGPEFAARVRRGFLTQAESDPAHWAVVDGTLDPVSLTARIVELVRARLGEG